jgi:putative transposase
MLNRTFGCVRVVWNRTLAARHARWQLDRTGTRYPETDRALTAMKRDPGLAFLNEVSSVPLQQALRHQHRAFQAFYERRARYPRFKSRRGRQSAHYTRSAFRMTDRALWLAKTAAPLRFMWTWPDVDVAVLEPTMVIVSQEPDGRWYVTFTIDAQAPEPLPPAEHAVGVDLGVTDFAVTSDGDRIPNPRHLERTARNLARYQRRLARCQRGSANRVKAAAKVARASQGPQRAAGLPAPRQHPAGPRQRRDRHRGPRSEEPGPEPAAGPRDLGLRVERVPPPASIQVRTVRPRTGHYRPLVPVQ